MTRRTERVNDLIRDEISALLRKGVKDPRLACFITVTEVKVSPDLRHARVFVSVMGTPDERREALRGLTAASGFFRRELSARLTIRYMPELVFENDDSIERGTHLLELIKQVTPDAPAPPEESQS